VKNCWQTNSDESCESCRIPFLFVVANTAVNIRGKLRRLVFAGGALGFLVLVDESRWPFEVGISQPPTLAAMAAAMDRYSYPEVVDVLAAGVCAQKRFCRADSAAAPPEALRRLWGRARALWCA
jgi:hypothetical protein